MLCMDEWWADLSVVPTIYCANKSNALPRSRAVAKMRRAMAPFCYPVNSYGKYFLLED